MIDIIDTSKWGPKV